jgi:hypothetical protein
MSRDRFSDCGATDDEVLEALQEEFDAMQKTARAYAARLHQAESIIGDISGDIKIFKPEMRDRIRAFLAPATVDGDAK